MASPSPPRIIVHRLDPASTADAPALRASADLLAQQARAGPLLIVTPGLAAKDAGGVRAIADELALAQEERGWIERLLAAEEAAPARFTRVAASYMLAALLRGKGAPADWLDPRAILQVRGGELGPALAWDESAKKLAAWMGAGRAGCVVAPGALGRDEAGCALVLERGGEDFSASAFAALLGAGEIRVWTGAGGVLSADPAMAPEAVVLERLSYAEACELAYFGADVIDPQAMAPAIARDIPIRILDPRRAGEGTLIGPEGGGAPPVKGIATIGALALVDVLGAGMIGVPGTAERVFSALHKAAVSVVMISQASSEHSICCAVAGEDAARAVEVLREAFAAELEAGQLQAIEARMRIAVLAAVGDGMAGTPGIAARLFETLARAGVNVRAIAQGSSERNISVAVDEADAARALRAVHAGFYLSPQTISIGVVGPGHVGGALLAQIAQARARLLREANLDLRVRAIAGSKRMLLSETAGEGEDWRARLARAGEALDWSRFADFVRASHLPHAMIVDCSASSEVADCYPAWLVRGVHVITPNKQAGSGPIARYRAVREAAGPGARFKYEATVGAGLPIITTLRDLIDTGDEVLAVDGILSGTLAWLFNRYDGGRPFSALVREAKAAGYTEPDPRDDLSGVDVARKLVILAREMGVELTLEKVAIESLVPPALQGVGREQFLERLEEMDAPMAGRFAAAREAGKVLRYVAALDKSGAARVGLMELAGDHAFAHIRLTDNVVQFTTARYRDNPLVVQGPGAGPDVTAAGVFADILRVASTLGAHL